jgi:hypothetical protein
MDGAPRLLGTFGGWPHESIFLNLSAMESLLRRVP